MRLFAITWLLALSASQVFGQQLSKEEITVLTSSDLIAFVGAKEPTRAKAFYRDTLGLRLVSEEPSHALVFDVNGTMLRLSIVPEVPPAKYTVLGWRVKDIQASVASLEKRGISFERFPGFNQDGRGIWTAPGGTKVAWFKDPDGNMLSVTEFPAEGPGKAR